MKGVKRETYRGLIEKLISEKGKIISEAEQIITLQLLVNSILL